MEDKVKIIDLTARYGEMVALKGVSIALRPSEFVTVLGPSGCGKTTLLRVLAGFAEYSGRIFVDGASMDGVPAHKRDIGIVFQDYALFPHMTVEQNIGFGLRMRNRAADERFAAVEAAVRLLRLAGLEKRYPHELSGGQQQRVALARAVAINPALLLLDEPLAALDKKLREEMQVELRQLQGRLGITTIFVTHDQDEALALSDRVIVMNQGEVRQFAPPAEVYDAPVDRFVADFVGKSNVVGAQVIGNEGGFLVCRSSSGAVIRALKTGKPGVDTPVYLSIRPERVQLWPACTAPAGQLNRLEGIVEHVTYLGHRSKVRVRLVDDTCFEVDQPNNESGQRAARWDADQPVALTWLPEYTVVLGK